MSVQPDFPFARERPMHPPRRIVDERQGQPPTRVRIWNGDHAWLLSRYDDVRAAFGDERLSSDPLSPGYPHTSTGSAVGRSMLPNFLVLDDPEHRRLRNLFLQDFMPKPLEARRGGIQAVVDSRADALLAAPQPADLIDVYVRAIPTLVLSATPGLEPEEARKLFKQMDVILRTESTHAEATAANHLLIDFLNAWLERRLKDPGEDMVSRLGQQMQAGVISREDILGSVRQLFLAGQDSTTGTMGMGVLLLLQHPDQLAMLRVKDDPALWRGAVDEILRFLSVTHFGRRRAALADVEIGGQLIRAGEGVILAENYANRDGATFPDPDIFDVLRPNAGKHLAFGYGIHHCLGINLARMELATGLATLFRRVPGLRLAVPAHDLAFTDGLTIYGLETLPVAWDA
ncbi:MAG: cytochrome [Caulobacteraceae bacterium]|nr:cytochrome [Caulobacteraceae bacterium]